MCVPPVLTGRVTAMTDAQWHGYRILHHLIIYTLNVHPAPPQPSDKQAYKQTGVQTDRRANRQAESDETHTTAASRRTDGRTDRRTDKQTD